MQLCKCLNCFLKALNKKLNQQCLNFIIFFYQKKVLKKWFGFGPSWPTKNTGRDANLSRHVLRRNKILEYLPKKTKIQIFDRNSNPVFIIETWTKGIRVIPWPNDYNWMTNQRYKVWTPQGRIPDNFIVLEKPKEEQSLTFSDFYSIISFYYNECMLFIRHDWKY